MMIKQAHLHHIPHRLNTKNQKQQVHINNIHLKLQRAMIWTATIPHIIQL